LRAASILSDQYGVSGEVTGRERACEIIQTPKILQRCTHPGPAGTAADFDEVKQSTWEMQELRVNKIFCQGAFSQYFRKLLQGKHKRNRASVSAARPKILGVPGVATITAARLF
jgi:hypothetical protein